jgi:hypothetical protein
MTTFLGLVRDFAAALIAVAMLFGVGITNEQAGGILLAVTTALALGAWIYRGVKTPA